MSKPLIFAVALLAGFAGSLVGATGPAFPIWKHLSSRTGDLPEPNGGRQQTAAVICDVDGDGVNDFILAERTQAPALIWMRYTSKGWVKYVIDNTHATPEAGGVICDVDGDGDPDLIIGGDYQSNQLWWYENPRPNFNPEVPWKRHIIKDTGAKGHHDQAVADFEGIGRPQLMFWNQYAQKLFLAHIPPNPRSSGPWPLVEILDTSKYKTANKEEGMAVYDIDGDGTPDLVAGMWWFKHVKGDEFKPIPFTDHPGRLAVGRFMPGKYPEIIEAPGDGNGPLMMYVCKGDPTNPKSWVGRDLLPGITVIHGHSLQLGDINGDGNLDIFCAEMGKWTDHALSPDNPHARAWILYGDGQGHFTVTLFSSGIGFHEAKVADFNGDGRLDILDKPYSWDTPRVDLWLNEGNGPPGAPPQKQRFTGPLSMELYTYRQEARQDLPGTLALIRKLGFTDIETADYYGRTAAEFRQELDRAGLTCSSIIPSYEKLENDLPGVVADAQSLGARYVVLGWVPHTGRSLTRDAIEKLAANCNRWGKQLKAHGLQFGYHPHGYEFVRTAHGTLFDTFIKLTNPKYVTIEMDVFWFAHAGADPVAYLEKYPDRFDLMHLKDLQKGSPTGIPDAHVALETSVPIGSGELDFPAILHAAANIGIRRYYIEDESPKAPEQVPLSQAYLEHVRFESRPPPEHSAHEP
ncbi:MAG: FG-GAP-like repeat-containing protein [Opitutaceae bacterium]